MSLENNNHDDNNKNHKKREKKSIYQIMDKQGFYIILILCVGIVTSTAIWVNNKDQYFIGEGPTNPLEEDLQPEVTLVEDSTRKIEDHEDVQETGKIGQGKPDVTDTKQIPSATEEIHTPKEKDSKENKAKEPVEEVKENKDVAAMEDTEDRGPVAEASASTIMMLPVAGEITLPFADDHLVYHQTLDQWSTHKGMDIKAKEGTPVKAALDGEVVEVLTDKIDGITITLKHDNDMYTRYSNLSTAVMVKVGDQIKKGQTISGVGKTASNKALEGPLLHFQVLIDDKFVDPQLYLSK